MDGVMTLNWLDPEFDVVFSELLFLYVIGLLILTIGFYRALYFISTGYALSITAMAVITPLRHLDNLTVISALQNILLLVWSLRLSVYLIRRKFRTSYRKRNAETHKTFSRIPLGFNLLIWVGVSFLYVLMFSPSLFQLSGHPAPTSWISYLVPIAGLVFMLSGLVLEAVADQQKSKFKAQFPGQFCNTGIYLWVRSPNYLGEILFWIGNWITSLMFYSTPLKWIASTFGMVTILVIMMGSTKRLEADQGERYGDQPEYQEFIRTVPVLFPFVPVYSLKNVRAIFG